MSPSTRTLVSGIGAFVVAGVAAFFIGGALGGGSTPPAALPVFQAPDPIVIPIAIPPDADPDEFVAAVAEDLETSRQASSDAGAGYVSPSDGGFVETSASGGSGGSGGSGSGATTTAPSTDDTTATTAAAGSDAGGPVPELRDPPVDDRVVDLCAPAEGDAPDGCPDGVGGTILLAIRDIPLVAVVEANPPAPGEGHSFASPTCPSEAYAAGGTVIGVSTSRPANIAIEYRQGRWTGSGYEVGGTVDVSTDAASEARWNAWLADETLSDRIPDAWIQHCISIDLPPRAGYHLYAWVTDKYAGELVRANPMPLNFDVRDEGFLPGERRRPTFLLGYGIDDLRVGVTKTPEQDVQMAAIPDTTPGVCDTGGVERSVIDRADAIRGVELTDTAIDPEVLSDPGYPWLVDHTRSIVQQVGLQEGTDYTLCIYWFAPGPSFDARVIDISEAVVVGTPEAYRPRLTLVDAANLYGDISTIGVRVPGCSPVTLDEMAIDRTGSPDWIGSPIELCTLETGLTEHDRGIRLTTGVGLADGTGYDNRPWIRTDLECDTAPCRIKLDDLAVVPLPNIPSEGCGTGFGTGCLSTDDPRRSAGDLIIRVSYLRTPGNGRTEWSIGEAAEFEDTPPALEAIPQVDVSVDYELRDGDPGFGARANVTVTADRPVSLRVEATQLETLCDAFGAPAYENPDLAMVHTFSLDTLCLGTPYRLLVTGRDGSGADLVVVPPRRIGDIAPYADIQVPPVLGSLHMTAAVDVPNDSNRYEIEIRPVRVQPRTVQPPYGADLGWSVSAEDRLEAQRGGWVMRALVGQIIACADVTGPPTLSIDAPRAPGALLGQEDVLITIDANVWRLHPVGGIYGECARDAVVDAVHIQQTVTITDLREGITLTSESGAVTITLRLERWRSELIG